MKDNEDYKEKNRIRKHEYYLRNKDVLRDKVRNRYNNDSEFSDKLKAKARALYHAKTCDIPKKKRGRKPRPKADNNDDEKEKSGEVES